MNKCQLPDLVEACTGLATCEDGLGDLSREICDLAATLLADPHYQLLSAVVRAAVALDSASNVQPSRYGTPLEVVHARHRCREAVDLATAVGLEGGDE